MIRKILLTSAFLLSNNCFAYVVFHNDSLDSMIFNYKICTWGSDSMECTGMQSTRLVHPKEIYQDTDINLDNGQSVYVYSVQVQPASVKVNSFTYEFPEFNYDEPYEKDPITDCNAAPSQTMLFEASALQQNVFCTGGTGSKHRGAPTA